VGNLTSSSLLYPFINFLQAERSLSSAIVFMFIDMEDLLVGAGQSSSCARSVRDDPRRATENEAHRASREFCRPVPEIKTSHFVSLKDSMVRGRKESALRVEIGNYFEASFFSSAPNRKW
jgi:hypothetical protein